MAISAKERKLSRLGSKGASGAGGGGGSFGARGHRVAAGTQRRLFATFFAFLCVGNPSAPLPSPFNVPSPFGATSSVHIAPATVTPGGTLGGTQSTAATTSNPSVPTPPATTDAATLGYMFGGSGMFGRTTTKTSWFPRPSNSTKALVDLTGFQEYVRAHP